MTARRENPTVKGVIGSFDEFLVNSKASDSSHSTSFLRRMSESMGDNSSSQVTTSPESFLNSFINLHTPSTSSRTKKRPAKEYQVDLSVVDLMSAKKTICCLESKINSLEMEKKKARIEHDSQQDQSLLEQRNCREKVEDIEKQNRALREQQVEMYEKLKVARQAINSTKIACDEKVHKLQNEKHEMKEHYEEELSTLQEIITDLKSKNLENDDIVVEASQEIELLQEKLTTQTKLAQDSLRKIESLEKCKELCVEANNKIKEMESKLSAQEDHAVMNKLLHSHLEHIGKLEKENAELKEENRILKEASSSNMLLQEKVLSLENSLQRAQERCRELNELQVKNEELQSKLKSWEELHPVSNDRTPAETARYIASLQATHLGLASENSELKAKITNLVEEKKELQEKCTRAEDEMKTRTAKFHLNAELIKRLQKKMLLITKERDSYKSILNSYEKEVTLNSSMLSNERVQTLEHMLENAHMQITSLETELENARKRILDKLEPGTKQQASLDSAQMNTLQKTLSSCKEENESLQTQLKESREEHKKLLEQKENLEMQLEHLTLSGGHNPSSTKVVHFKMNPVAVARANLTTQKQVNGSNEEVEALKEQLKNAELRNKRFMQAFTEKSQEFREVCYMLFGYRVDMFSEHQYKVISMYAERADDYLLFKLTSKKNELQLLETDFSKHVSNLIENYLKQQHSIPAFLGSLTLDLFVQQTNTFPISMQS